VLSEGLSLKNKQQEKQPVTEEEESKFWNSEVFGMKTAKALLNVIYFYNGKLFGLQGGEHRDIRVGNFKIGKNYIQNISRGFY